MLARLPNFIRRGRKGDATDAAGRLVVGLGNPGGQYLGTRHNVGFEVIEVLAARVGVRLRRGRGSALQAVARIADARVVLVEPQTYVNLSGRAVRALADYYHVAPADLLVVCDDVHLPVGRMRVRRAGGAGGHNGLVSIVAALGTREFPRLRVGVDEPPPYMDQADYVLSRFTSAERAPIGAAIARAADAVETWVREGIEATMNQYNAGAEPPRPA